MHRTKGCFFLGFIFLGMVAALSRADTIVIRSPVVSPPGFLGTCDYAPLPNEAAFFDRLSEKGRVTVDGYSPSEAAFHKSDFFKQGNPKSTPEEIETQKPRFSLARHVGEFVSWFGIVRGVEKVGDGYRLTIQNKYSTGMTDCHIQTVSIWGRGDFAGIVTTKELALPPLALVRVYGTVVREVDGMPEVKIEYLRYWRWMTFNFSDYGRDAGVSRFDKHLKLDGLRIYSSRVSGKYYAERIEATDEDKAQVKAWWAANVNELRAEFEKVSGEQEKATKSDK